jgi:hypothetical protein
VRAIGGVLQGTLVYIKHPTLKDAFVIQKSLSSEIHFLLLIDR